MAESAKAAEKAETETNDAPEKPAAKPKTKRKKKGGPVYYTATGRRKKAVARVRLTPGTGRFQINGPRDLLQYFGRDTLVRWARQPLVTVGAEEKFDVLANIDGGGLSGQAGALRHGIARALIVADENLRADLKKEGLLTRDPRMAERKKYGLKKARKKPQFSKR